MVNKFNKSQLTLVSFFHSEALRAVLAMRAPNEILFDTNALKVRTSAQHVDFLMLGLELDRLTPDFLREAPPER